MTELRYSRQIVLDQWGEAGQQALSSATMLVVGLGGLGNPCSQYLACAGVGRLLLNDFDTVDATNLPRQPLFRPTDIGAGKAQTVRAALAALNPACELRVLDQRLTPAELAATVAGTDVVFDASDNFGTRFAVNAACVAAQVPLVSGAAIRYEAQLAVFRNDRPGGPCYRCLYDENAETVGDCEGHGVLSPLVGMVGAAMALEGMRIVVGFGDNPGGWLLLTDALSGQWRRLQLSQDPACPVCSTPK